MDASLRMTRETVGTGVAQRDAIQNLTEDTTLDVTAARVHGTANSTYDSWTLTLPSVSEAAG